MKIGEVGLLTNDVPRLAAFYRRLLEVEGGSDDATHQFILSEETSLSIYNDGTPKNNRNQNICLAFTVDDIEREYKKGKSPWRKDHRAPHSTALGRGQHELL